MGQVGLVIAMAGATGTVRCYFVVHNRLLRNAFEAGRESVRPLR